MPDRVGRGEVPTAGAPRGCAGVEGPSGTPCGEGAVDRRPRNPEGPGDACNIVVAGFMQSSSGEQLLGRPDGWSAALAAARSGGPGDLPWLGRARTPRAHRTGGR